MEQLTSLTEVSLVRKVTIPKLYIHSLIKVKLNIFYILSADTFVGAVNQGPICRGGWGFNPPNDFFDPRVSVDLSSWGGVDSNPSVSVTC